MNLTEIKNAHTPKRKLFEIERAIVREATDLWCKEKSFFDDNFSEDVEVDFKGRIIHVVFNNTQRMKHGSPEATVNEMMRGLVLTMTTDQHTGKLLSNHEAIISNIIDVFVYRLREIAERKFIYQRLQSLELGFSIAFGLDKEFYPIRRERRFLEEVLTVASLSTAAETVVTLIHDMFETESLAPKEHGVTFHIFMRNENEASFISLPFGMEQASYISLLGTHTLRCNVLAEPGPNNTIKSGILKIDAPSDPLNFITHKGLALPVEEQALMHKLRSADKLTTADFSAEELTFLKLLFNEYVQLAHFLLSSNRVDPGLRLLIIFPRVNIFEILHEKKRGIPAEEPQTLQELAALHTLTFRITTPRSQKKKDPYRRIPEKVIQGKVLEAVQAFARHIISNIYKPTTVIKREFTYYTQKQYADQKPLETIHQRLEEISSYLKKLNRIQRFVLAEDGKSLDLEASMQPMDRADTIDVLEEIVQNIQASEMEKIKEIIVSKMLDYLSSVSVRLQQLQRVSSPYIKQEIVKEIEAYTSSVLVQAKSFYSLMSGKPPRRRH
ncbi:hypothetical protein ACFL43_05290 [Thermodesulfobacteriota bacterium]